MIEPCIRHIESILKRNLTGEEVLILGTAYQRGLHDGRKWREELEEAERESAGKGEKKAGFESS